MSSHADNGQFCNHVQCAMYKTDSWEAEPGDEDDVFASEKCFLTGISTEPPRGYELRRIRNVRHGIASCMVTNENLQLNDKV